jgi:imidazolonepropionase-like amidohydrolase
VATEPDAAVTPAGRSKTALTNVRVFDGRRLTDPGTVVIDGSVIGTDPAGARVVDGGGGVLLPGLIDCHVHFSGRHNLEKLSDYGVTTALDMGTPWALVDSLCGLSGLADIRSSGKAAVAPGSPIPETPPEAELTDPEQAAGYVDRWVTAGADYIKIIVMHPHLDQATLRALVAAAHQHGKLTIAHATTFDDIAMAQDAQVDVVTHAPRDRALDEAAVARMTADDRISVPTLTMMEAISNGAQPPGQSYGPAKATVAALHKAGVAILAGTDANDTEGTPAPVSHGDSLHHELKLLVDAGLPTVDALRAATVLPARHFRLPDRGAVEPGLRADLVLIAGDPVRDITATRQIQRTWFAGVARSHT